VQGYDLSSLILLMSVNDQPAMAAFASILRSSEVEYIHFLTIDLLQPESVLSEMVRTNRSLESRLLIHHHDQIYGTPLTHTHQATDNVNERRYTSKSDRNRAQQSHAKT
jgi:hypothetical protein